MSSQESDTLGTAIAMWSLYYGTIFKHGPQAWNYDDTTLGF